MIRSGPALGALLFTTACASPTSLASRWSGPVTPETPSSNCTPTRAVLDLARNNQATFAPNEATLILKGALTQDGRLIATQTLIGADKRPYVMRLEATRSDTTITGTYATPRCRYAVNLTQQR